MKIPKRVKIGAHTFTIRQENKNLSNEDSFGRSEMRDLEIFMRKDAPQTLKEETFIHEVLHMIRELNSLDLKDVVEEEKFVQTEAHALYQFLKDNNLLK